ncbi:MAG TPA: hypothetical protein VMG35_27865 [Bryobacteraceae bacterium]|nr:hypothetical protein [Bryobacteraceae bacterium]
MLGVLILSLAGIIPKQAPPEGWKLVKDSRGVCQIAVPGEWELLPGDTGAAVLNDSTNAIAVVTSQPGQTFQRLPENLQKLLGIRTDKIFENTAKRVFYQDRISRSSDEPNAYSASVPGRTGTCSCHIVLAPNIPEETAKKIALSLGPAARETEPSAPDSNK